VPGAGKEARCAKESNEECYDKLNFMQLLCSNVEWFRSRAKVRCIINDVESSACIRSRSPIANECSSDANKKNPTIQREKCCKSIFYFPIGKFMSRKRQLEENVAVPLQTSRFAFIMQQISICISIPRNVFEDLKRFN
jgi:hypothetical protein